MNTFAIVNADGSVLWMFPAVIKTYCTLDVQHFPFDNQKCSIIFISWTFNGLKLDVTYNQSEQQAVYYTPKNQEWYVDNVTVERHEKIYACCVEPYPDVTFTIHMTRRSLFYIINLIFPCLLIYAVSFLGFFLPVESGEKVNLEITILLALVVFLLIVGETLPPTPDAIPVLGEYCSVDSCSFVLTYFTSAYMMFSFQSTHGPLTCISLFSAWLTWLDYCREKSSSMLSIRFSISIPFLMQLQQIHVKAFKFILCYGICYPFPQMAFSL